MGYRNVIIFSLVAVSCAKFQFDNEDIIHDITTNLSHFFGTRCLTILRPLHEAFEENAFLTRLTKSFVKKDKEIFQTMSYRMEHYVNLYSDPIRINEGSCFKWTTILMVTNSTRLQLQELVKTPVFSRPLWLLFANQSVIELFDGLDVRYDSWVGLIEPKTDSTFSISEVYQIQKGMKVIFSPVGEWSVENGLEGFVPDERLDWKGAVFRAGAHENWPAASFSRGEAGKNREIDGFFTCIWFEFQEMLNFTTEIVRGRNPGNEVSPGNWSGLVGMAMRKEIDVILSELDFTVGRIKALKHLTPILRSEFQIFFADHGYALNLLSVFYPFHYLVWITLASWVISAAGFIYFTSKITQQAGLNNSYQLSPTNALFFIFQTLAYQGSSNVPKVWAQRVLFLVCYLAAAIIVPSYSASLISSLTVRTPEKPFDSLRGILKTDYRLILSDSSSHFDYFSKSTDPEIQNILYKHALNDSSLSYDLNEITKRMCFSKNIAYFTHAAFIESDLAYYRTPHYCDFQSLSSPVSKVFASLSFPKQSPYPAKFNAIVLRMFETGLMQRQRLRYSPKTKKIVPRSDLSMKFIDMAAIFILFSANVVFSILIFAFELMNCFPHGCEI